MALVAQLATTTCATYFVLPASGTICTTGAKDITYIISLALLVQIVPLTGKTNLVAQVVVASCATCVTVATSLVPDTHSYLLDFFALVMPLFWACCALYSLLAQVAQLATTTCTTNFVLPASGTTSDKWHN